MAGVPVVDGVVAIVDQLPAIRVTKIAEGNRTQIEAALARLRIEAAAAYSMVCRSMH